jgi:hypothetical protein
VSKSEKFLKRESLRLLFALVLVLDVLSVSAAPVDAAGDSFTTTTAFDLA